MSNKDLQQKRKLVKSPAEKPISLRPLKVEEAISDLLQVPPRQRTTKPEREKKQR